MHVRVLAVSLAVVLLSDGCSWIIGSKVSKPDGCRATPAITDFVAGTTFGIVGLSLFGVGTVRLIDDAWHSRTHSDETIVFVSVGAASLVIGSLFGIAANNGWNEYRDCRTNPSKEP